MSEAKTPTIQDLMHTARQAAEAGGRAALRYFKTQLEVEHKTDDSPVTEADKQSEAAILAAIQLKFPSHSILAEESGRLDGDPEFRWIIDPIDGTRGFIRGGQFWGALIGVEHKGQLVAGSMCLPALDRSYWAGKGLGCFRNGIRLQVSPVKSLSDATLSLGEMQNLLRPPHQQAVLNLIQSVASTRGYGDPGGLFMVLEGLADVWLEAGVKPWDLAHAKILIEEAGGTYSDFNGEPSIEGGTAIASNGHLHQTILETLRKFR